MDIDEALSQALQRYGSERRRIGKGIAQSVPNLPRQSGDVLGCIARIEQPNITALADALGVTRGGASKAAARLQEASLVESYQLPENRKEVYLRLTPAGRLAYERMHELQESVHSMELAYLAPLPEEDKRTALRFIKGLALHLSGLALPVCRKEEDA